MDLRANLGSKPLENVFLLIFMFKTTKKKQKATNRKCRLTVDIAYKRVVLYGGFPRLRKYVCPNSVGLSNPKRNRKL